MAQASDQSMLVAHLHSAVHGDMDGPSAQQQNVSESLVDEGCTLPRIALDPMGAAQSSDKTGKQRERDKPNHKLVRTHQLYSRVAKWYTRQIQNLVG